MSSIALLPERDSWSVTGISSDAERIAAVLREIKQHFAEPLSRTSTARRFADLAATWKSETGFTSSIQQAVMSPTYQEIIGLGDRAVPFLLAELYREPAHWFWALTAITGENPVRPESRGSVPRMAHDWLTWGQARGLAP